ncbi:IclR family transcriptional regulator domain-containing protein [Brumicola nitratireducens]|uniref:Transcriptional regulator, IclR-family n=1 Tax=Glaciecola nitratireducens (strain JCM 12485 / KCTC 12276 / FR1064) TaxID=1085623 RepID=G4QNA6_GLANF|nr:IclR family transcriptional regulator C-terminal domain-containing protein [Glaciecola nitratireducens]AEP31525.1 transcriptional regulator, IclR-family [Glaciecola nitratireducens FR1064]
MSTIEKDPEYLHTLERGLTVLRVFDQSRPEMQLSEVAVATGLSPAVARRCLNTLVKLGYVGKVGRKFLLKPEVLVFGSAFLASASIDTVVSEHLQRLRDETGDSASMTVLSGSDILYLAHITTQRHIRLNAGIGTRFPAHATSMGKVLLAHQKTDTLENYLATAQLDRLTDQTITNPDTLRDKLKIVREQGYASSLNELDYGLVSTAVPIFDESGNILAAINCSTGSSRIAQEEMVRTRLPILLNAARDIQFSLSKWPILRHALLGN